MSDERKPIGNNRNHFEEEMQAIGFKVRYLGKPVRLTDIFRYESAHGGNNFSNASIRRLESLAEGRGDGILILSETCNNKEDYKGFGKDEREVRREHDDTKLTLTLTVIPYELDEISEEESREKGSDEDCSGD